MPAAPPPPVRPPKDGHRVPRNKVAAHGGGPVAHNVFAEAEAVVAGAAGAIAYLATHLP